MMRSKITKNTRRHSISNGHNESNPIGTSGFIQRQQCLLGQQFGNHNSSIRTVRSQNIFRQHNLLPQQTLRRSTLIQNIHATERIQTAQLSQTCLRQRHSLFLPLGYILGCNIKVRSTMHLLTNLVIVKHHPPHITQYQILRRFHTYSSASHDEHIEILETRDGITTECSLLTIDTFGFLIDIIAGFVGAHPSSPGYFFVVGLHCFAVFVDDFGTVGIVVGFVVCFNSFGVGRTSRRGIG
mmetsp:Transcript_33227/g.61178  ORF Transcript_33227/g.61178 Transcript_33227/m.61178 type:complete len:240 (-) Transcript_33227:117-836(-)